MSWMKTFAALFLLACLGPACTRVNDEVIESGRITRPDLSRMRVTGVDGYLATVHDAVREEWNTVLEIAAREYPRTHPVNQQSLMTEIELGIAGDGKRTHLRLRSRSGCHIFDNSALRVMSFLMELPPLPAALGPGDATLVWRFHRDARAATPRYARLVHHAAGPEESLRQAIARKDWPAAEGLLTQHIHQPSIPAVLVDAALATKDPRFHRLALEIAPTELVVALTEAAKDPRSWQAGLAVLERRRATEGVLRLLRHLLRRQLYWVVETQTKDDGSERILLLAEALHRLGGAVPRDLLESLLSSKRTEVIMAGLALARSVEDLDKMKGSGELRFFVLVKRHQLQPAEKTRKEIRVALAGSQRLALLDVLEKMPVAELADDLADLTKNPRTPPEVQVRAINVLSQLSTRNGPLLVALRSRNTEVQVAAIRALSRTKENQRGVSYRLAEVAYKGSGPVRAEALAAVVRIGIDYFRADVLFRIARLPVAEQIVVARELWRYGKEAESVLNKLAESPGTQLKQAARSSLARLSSGAAAGAKAPAAATSEDDGPATPLGTLLRLAITLLGGK